MAGNGVAANLFMAAILFAGLVALTGLEREAWPTLPFNQIEVSMAYPGATPEEVEESIVVKIEEQVESLDDVKTVKSIAAPGMASVKIEVKSGTDINRALDDVESAVNRIQSFPASAERPEIRELTNRQSMIRLVVYGDVSEHSLKELASPDRRQPRRAPCRVPSRNQRHAQLRDLHRSAFAPPAGSRPDPRRRCEYDSPQFP